MYLCVTKAKRNMKTLVINNGLIVIEGSSVIIYKKSETAKALEGVSEFEVKGQIPTTMFNKNMAQLAALGFSVKETIWNEALNYSKPGVNFCFIMAK